MTQTTTNTELQFSIIATENGEFYGYWCGAANDICNCFGAAVSFGNKEETEQEIKRAEKISKANGLNLTFNREVW